MQVVAELTRRGLLVLALAFAAGRASRAAAGDRGPLPDEGADLRAENGDALLAEGGQPLRVEAA